MLHSQNPLKGPSIKKKCVCPIYNFLYPESHKREQLEITSTDPFSI